MFFKRSKKKQEAQAVIIPTDIIKKTDEISKKLGIDRFMSISFEEFCKQNNIKKPNER